MSKVYVKLEGLQGVISALKAIAPEMKAGRVVRNAVRKGAIVIQQEEQANVRRLVAETNRGGEPSKSTGALEHAITVRRRRPPGGSFGEVFSVGVSKVGARVLRAIGKALGEVHDPRYYQWFLEFGTEKMQAHPFIRPAFEAKKDEALATIVEQILSGLERVQRKVERMFRVKT